MSKIMIRHAEKRFGNQTIIPDLSLDIEDGELFTLLGPSGCGKTTLLRMIAGFNSIEGGDFYFNDLRINDMDPSKRNIGMVFQNYAIFPHMTVYDNVAYGLKNRKMDKKSIKELTGQYLELMQISSFATRMPNQLSGGQQQRVALARALVISPDVLLMDEPLSNLDAKLRLEMRSVIRDIQKTVGITTVYVTHDQEEAMAISDTIAVMKDGIIQHIGTPREIYQRPKNLFVASFIGRTNILGAKIKENVLIIGDTYRLSLEHFKRLPDLEVLCSIRPEDFVLTQAGEDGIGGVLKECSYLGLNTHYVVDIGGGVLVDVIEESSLDEELQPGQTTLLQVKGHRINLFDKEGSTNLVRSETREKAK